MAPHSLTDYACTDPTGCQVPTGVLIISHLSRVLTLLLGGIRVTTLTGNKKLTIKPQYSH